MLLDAAPFEGEVPPLPGEGPLLVGVLPLRGGVVLVPRVAAAVRVLSKWEVRFS